MALFLSFTCHAVVSKILGDAMGPTVGDGFAIGVESLGYANFVVPVILVVCAGFGVIVVSIFVVVVL